MSINFHQLPNDIKFSIFSMNRQETSDNINHNKQIYNGVISELNDIIYFATNKLVGGVKEDQYEYYGINFSFQILDSIRLHSIDKLFLYF